MYESSFISHRKKRLSWLEIDEKSWIDSANSNAENFERSRLSNFRLRSRPLFDNRRIRTIKVFFCQELLNFLVNSVASLYSTLNSGCFFSSISVKIFSVFSYCSHYSYHVHLAHTFWKVVEKLTVFYSAYVSWIDVGTSQQWN